MFEVRILGTSAAIPTNSRFPSAQVVTIRDRHHLVDCGEGTQMQLLKNRVKFSRLDAIFISHLHGDHVLGVPGLLNSLSLYERNFPLKLFAPSGLQEILRVVFAQTRSYLTYELEFTPTEDFEPGAIIYKNKDFQVELLPLHHRVFSRGFRFVETGQQKKLDFYKAKALNIPNPYFKLLKQGNSIVLEDGQTIYPEDVLIDVEDFLSYAYCSDTQYHEPLIPYIQNTTVLYHESTFLKDLQKRAYETGHSTAKDAGTIAKRAAIKQLLLGHFSARYKDLNPFLEEAQGVFPDTMLAKEGQLYKIKDYA